MSAEELSARNSVLCRVVVRYIHRQMQRRRWMHIRRYAARRVKLH